MDDKFESWNELFVPESRERHRISFRMFLEANESHATADELLNEARNDRKSDASPVEYMYVRRLSKYKKYLLNRIGKKTGKPLSPGTVHTYFSDMVGFYEHFGFTVPRAARKIIYEDTDSKVKTHTGVAVNKQTITEMLEKADVLEKALILAQVSSGLSNADLVNLRVGQFKSGRHPSGITVLKDLRRQKTRNTSPIKFITFFSKEATEAIDEYLDYRNTPPVHKTHNSMVSYQKRKVTSDNNYLFVKKKIGEPVAGARDSDAYRKLSTTSLLAMYRKLHPPTGDSFDWNDVRGHLLRKYFSNVLTRRDVQTDYAETMMGHSLGGSRDFYHLPDIDKLIEAYLKCEADFIFTNKELLEEADARNREEIKGLKADNKELFELMKKYKLENEMTYESIRQMEMEFDGMRSLVTASSLYESAKAVGNEKLMKMIEEKLKSQL